MLLLFILIFFYIAHIEKCYFFFFHFALIIGIKLSVTNGTEHIDEYLLR
jgi:hypothetical protein